MGQVRAPQFTAGRCAAVDIQLRDRDRFASRRTEAGEGFDIVVGPVVRDVAPIARSMTGDDFVFAAPRWRDHLAIAIARYREPLVQPG